MRVDGVHGKPAQAHGKPGEDDDVDQRRHGRLHHDDHLKNRQAVYAAHPVDEGINHHEKGQERDQDFDHRVQDAAARLGQNGTRLQRNVEESDHADLRDVPHCFVDRLELRRMPPPEHVPEESSEDDRRTVVEHER